jgi:hypothetical protein
VTSSADDSDPNAEADVRPGQGLKAQRDEKASQVEVA